jgi:hypothetical protein
MPCIMRLTITAPIFYSSGCASRNDYNADTDDAIMRNSLALMRDADFRAGLLKDATYGAGEQGNSNRRPEDFGRRHSQHGNGV